MTMPTFGAGGRGYGSRFEQMARKIDTLSGYSDALRQPPTCIATRVANQSIPNNAVTAVQLDTLVTDSVGGMFVPTTSIITIPTAGVWDIIAGGQWESATTGERLLMIYINGAEQVGGGQTCSMGAVAAAVRQNAGLPLTLAAATQVEMRVFQTSGVARNFIGRLSAILRGY